MLVPNLGENRITALLVDRLIASSTPLAPESRYSRNQCGCGDNQVRNHVHPRVRVENWMVGH